MDLSDRRSQTSPVLGAARTGTDWCRLLHTRPSPLAGRIDWAACLKFDPVDIGPRGDRKR